MKYLLCAAELESGGCHGDRGVRKGARGRTPRAIPHVWTQTERSHACQCWPAVTEGERACARRWCVPVSWATSHANLGAPLSAALYLASAPFEWQANPFKLTRLSGRLPEPDLTLMLLRASACVSAHQGLCTRSTQQTIKPKSECSVCELPPSAVLLPSAVFPSFALEMLF